MRVLGVSVSGFHLCKPSRHRHQAGRAGAVVAQARRLLLGGPAFRSPSPQRLDSPSLSANYEPEFARQLVASEGLTKKFQRFRQSVLYRES
jgi:hypothetical protein